MIIENLFKKSDKVSFYSKRKIEKGIIVECDYDLFIFKVKSNDRLYWLSYVQLTLEK